MNITFRKNINEFEKKWLEQSILAAQDYLKKLYDNPNFENLDYIFSKTYSRSRYFRNEVADGKYKTPTCCIAIRNIIYLYPKESLKLKRYYITGVNTNIAVMCSLIHELTHHIQYNEKRTCSELETTKNEVEYLKAYHPYYYNSLLF